MLGLIGQIQEAKTYALIFVATDIGKRNVYSGMSADAVNLIVQLVVYFFTATVALLSWFTMARG